MKQCANQLEKVDQPGSPNPEMEDVGKPTFTFDGYPVDIRPIDGDIIIRCKNVIGLYSQIQTFLHRDKSMCTTHWFGVRQKDRCEITQSILKRGGLQIGCLTASKEETKKLELYCNHILNNQDYVRSNRRKVTD